MSVPKINTGKNPSVNFACQGKTFCLYLLKMAIALFYFVLSDLGMCLEPVPIWGLVSVGAVFGITHICHALETFVIIIIALRCIAIPCVSHRERKCRHLVTNLT